MVCGELAQQRSFFLWMMKWVWSEWVWDGLFLQLKIDQISTTHLLLSLHLCLFALKEWKKLFLETYFDMSDFFFIYIYISINITFIYKKLLCNSITAISWYKVCNVCWYTGKTLTVPHPVLSPEPPLCVHLHVGLTACVLLYSGSENAFHASSVASEKVKKSNRKWDVGVIADRDTGSIDVAKFGSNHLSVVVPLIPRICQIIMVFVMLPLMFGTWHLNSRK